MAGKEIPYLVAPSEARAYQSPNQPLVAPLMSLTISVPGEPRRSGRATKGQHTKNQDSDAPTPKRLPKGKAKSTKPNSAEPDDDDDDDDDEEEDAIIRCICGATEDDESGWTMVCCDNCAAWQHNLCMGIPEDNDLLPESYYCEQCRPGDHADLLAAMKRGEKPWEARQQKRRERDDEKKKKKGKKGSKAKGPRQSGAEPATERSTPAKASPKATPVPQETSGSKRKFEAVDGANGHSQVASPTETATPTLPDPKSPSVEVDKSAKRSKSTSEASRRASLLAAVPKVEAIDQLPKDRRQPAAKALNADFKGLISKAVKDGSFAVPKGKTPEALTLQLALDIEHAIQTMYQNDPSGYAEKFRSLKFNLKKNHTLSMEVLNGELTPEYLVEMSSEEMANEELQKERVKIKEAADKQAVLVHEEGPRYRKTHKGDELIEQEVVKPIDVSFQAPVRRRTLDQDAANASGSPVQSPSATTELPEDFDRPGLAIDTNAPSSKSSSFNIQQVWKNVRSPGTDSGPLRKRQRRSSTIKDAEVIVKRDAAEDAEMDHLLRDDDDDTAVSPTTINPASGWRGRFTMGTQGAFNAIGTHCAGGAIGLKVPYLDLLGANPDINGRIAIPRANTYLEELRFSSTQDVSVLRLHPLNTEADRSGYASIFNYLRSKDRWGVNVKPAHELVKDLYVVPVDSDAQLPGFMQQLEPNTSMEEERQFHHELLLVIVARTKKPATPSVNRAPVPFSPVAPAQSPMAESNATFASSASTPQSQVSNLARQLLGPFINAPVVVQILQSVGDMSEIQLQNLRDVLEVEPAARDNIEKLSEHLYRRQREADEKEASEAARQAAHNGAIAATATN
jgi:hypothetical protein